MIYIATNHGTGDSYMTLAFAKAVERTRGQPVTVLVPPQHAAIASMFPDVATVASGEPLIDHMLKPNDLIVAHPSSVPKRVRIDHLCLLSRRLTHADLWRAMLDLPPEEPMPRGRWPFPETQKRKVVLIPDARSWPNTKPEFWALLQDALKKAGRSVFVNNGGWSLELLLNHCAEAEWVIGANCGVMVILCHAMFPCRKTICSVSVDDHEYFKRTRPYADGDTFAGERYADLDEVTITADVGAAVEHVLGGPCAQSEFLPTGLVSGMQVTLSHGDFFDRYSVLCAKMKRLAPDKRSRIMRDYLQHKEIADAKFNDHGVHLREIFNRLLGINLAAFDQNEVAVTAVLGGGSSEDHYAKAVVLNKRRTELKDEINRICKSVFGEVKSYYEEGTR